MFSSKTNFCGIIVFVLLSISVFHINGFDIESDLIFRLYTQEEPNTYIALKSNLEPPPTFNPNRPTRIFIHGFKSSEKVLLRYKDAYLKFGDYNFIAVDWTRGAATSNYLKAKGRIQPISVKLAELITIYFTYGMKSQDVTIVGHSLGAHIAGLAAKQVESSNKISNIVGLDPASVGFDYSKSHKRLAISDADYVQIIHTDGKKYGFSKPLGHADFYPNLGRSQPGCDGDMLGKCSHIRAHSLFLESLTSQFPAVQCNSYDELQQQNKCTFHNVIGIMGGDITANTPKHYGIFFLETKATSPFNIPDYRSFSNKTIVYPPKIIQNKINL